MANKRLFQSAARTPAVADTRNKAGGKAYSVSSEHALAQFAATGTFSDTFYANAKTQLKEFKEIAEKCDSAFIAQLAVYARHSAFMKDTPAFLLAILTARGELDLLKQVFPVVISGGRMLRTYVQMVRSGEAGRKSFGSAPKRLIQQWIQKRNWDSLFRDNVGNSPSMGDILRMVHPKPKSVEQNALFAYIAGKPFKMADLPPLVQQFEAFKKDGVGEVPDLPINMMSSFKLSRPQWREKILQLPWQAMRMNLATATRHGVFEGKVGEEAAKRVAEKLSNPELIEKAKVFPYTLLQAYKFGTDGLPRVIVDAIHDAMEISTRNVPMLEGGVAVAVDMSGSMCTTLDRDGVERGRFWETGRNSSGITLHEIAALFTSMVLRNNPDSSILQFDTSVKPLKLEPRDTILTNAKKMVARGGGTSVSAPLVYWNKEMHHAKNVVIISDYESWFDVRSRGGTAAEDEWLRYKRRVRDAKLFCIDLTPQKTAQVKQRSGVLKIGGFSDAVFKVMEGFSKGSTSSDYWVDMIKNTPLS